MSPATSAASRTTSARRSIATRSTATSIGRSRSIPASCTSTTYRLQVQLAPITSSPETAITGCALVRADARGTGRLGGGRRPKTNRGTTRASSSRSAKPPRARRSRDTMVVGHAAILRDRFELCRCAQESVRRVRHCGGAARHRHEARHAHGAAPALRSVWTDDRRRRLPQHWIFFARNWGYEGGTARICTIGPMRSRSRSRPRRRPSSRILWCHPPPRATGFYFKADPVRR